LKITVVGLGKIGLPLAVQFASRGHEVVGADVNAGTVATINSGQEPFPGESHLQEKLADAVRMGLLKATTETAVAVTDSDAVVVVVPLFVDGEGSPDFDWMDSATKDIARGLKPGTLVAYETTLPVGTTRTRWKPMLEEGSGLTEGTDFHLVFSPERVLTGRVFEDLRKTTDPRRARENRAGRAFTGWPFLMFSPFSMLIGPSPRPHGCPPGRRRRRCPGARHG